MLWISEFRNPDMSRAYCFPLVLPNLQLSQSSGHSILKWSLSWSLLQFTVFTIAQGCWWSPPNLESYPPPLNIVTSQQEESFFFFVSVNLISPWPVCVTDLAMGSYHQVLVENQYQWQVYIVLWDSGSPYTRQWTF